MLSTTKTVLSRLVLSTLLGGSLLASSGCFHSAVLMPTVPPGERHSTWVNGWLWGSVGGQISADIYCQGRGVARIDTKRSVGNILVSWVTLGIYTPSHVSVTCANPNAYGMTPPPPPASYGGGYGYGYGYSH
jgi:hypothetical protein